MTKMIWGAALLAAACVSETNHTKRPVASATPHEPSRAPAAHATEQREPARAEPSEPARAEPSEPARAEVSEPARDTAPFWLDSAETVLVYPPVSAARPQPVTVFLHGMCDAPEIECPWIAPAATSHGWLVCPRAGVACQGGGTAWSLGDVGRRVDSAVAALTTARPGELSEDDGRIAGFSLGGTAALKLALEGRGRWSRVVVIAARVALERTQLERAGISSVVLAAGELDTTYDGMRAVARRLDRAGFPATFLSLGRVGHTFPADMDAKMVGALGGSMPGG